MRGWLGAVARFFGGSLGRHDEGAATLHVDVDGLTLEKDGGESVHVEFDAIRRITAFKVDLMTRDAICLEIVSDAPSGVRPLLVHEQMAGFSDLFGAFERLGVSAEWYLEVMQPAFAENRTVIFSRAGGGGVGPD